MGNCQAGENLTAEEKAARRKEAEVNRALERDLVSDHSADQQVNKLLLLGAGESGKSTLFKQMIEIYGKGFPEGERRTYAPIIYNNIITSMKVLCQQVDVYGNGRLQAHHARRVVEDLKGEEPVDENLGQLIQQLWRDEGIQDTYNMRAKYQLTDSAAYYFDQLDVISKKDYLPTKQDVLRSRVRTTGIVENEFIIEENHFKMFDVGGQRNERKKWIHCFENVTAVLFVAAISEYDQVLYEDENTNRMVEALNLFEEICNSRWFRDTAMILFLNKRDLFAEKIQKVALNVCFPEYTGEESYEACSEFMQQQFEDRNRNPDKQIYAHVTCATDTDNVSAVFDAVKDIIIRQSLKGAGLV